MYYTFNEWVKVGRAVLECFVENWDDISGKTIAVEILRTQEYMQTNRKKSEKNKAGAWHKLQKSQESNGNQWIQNFWNR